MKRLSAILMALLCIACGIFAKDRKDSPDCPLWLDCNYLEDPAVIDTPSPRLSWVNQVPQTAYQILVATAPDLLVEDEADVWNSGKVFSDESNLVSYGGPELMSMKDYFWAVRVWDTEDKPTDWSSAGQWTTGMMNESDWKARWIGSPDQEEVKNKQYVTAPMFRKEFKVGGGLVSAKAFICGLGYFEMHLNGQKVGDDYLVPGLTDYTRRPYLGVNPRIPLDPDVTAYRTLYLAYDITDQLKKGENTVGVILGNGYFHVNTATSKIENYGVPRLICQILLTYADGHDELVCSDTSWKVMNSPIIFNDLYEGEVYDANKEVKGWDKPGLNDSKWKAAVLRKAPEGRLTANMGPTDKVTESIKPVSFKKQEDGTWKVDFGKVISGWIRFGNIKGAKGDTLSVNYLSEYPSPKCKYIFNSGKKTSFAPRFEWFVFREAIISGIDNLKAEDLTAEAVNTDVPLNSQFECSNDLFVKINDIWRRSQMDNMHSCIPSDCPHREKLPYTGDGQIAMNTVMSNFEAESFYNKWISDIRGSQNPKTGYVPNGAPWEPYCGGGPAWGAAICIMPWEFYLRYGDYEVLEDNLDAMKGYLNYFASWKRPDGTIHVQKAKPDGEPFYWYNLGDWAPSYQNPDDALVHTFYFWYCAVNTSKAAHAIGQERTACQYEAIAKETWEAFHRVFYKPEEKSYGDFGSNVYALYMGVPQDRCEDVKATLRNELEVKYKRHLNTGMLATRFLFETLSMNGMGDLAYDIMNQNDFPSYGWWISQGATTTWEQWNGSDSRNHPMFGGGLTWFYRILAGVNTDPDEPGFRHIIIRPVPAAKLDDVLYRTETRYGTLVSKVTHKDGVVHIAVTIPMGCHATVYVPKSLDEVTKNPMSDDSYTIHEVTGGTWSF